MNKTYNRFWFIVLLELIILDLFATTFIDIVVHNILYRYGLQFSYEWADMYWFWIAILRLTIACIAAVSFYFLRDPSERDKQVSIAIFITLVSLYFGFILDSLFFVIIGAFPPLDSIWWWNPFYRFFGIRWTTLENLIYNFIWISIDIIIWVYIKYRFDILEKIRSVRKRNY